jgi:dihydrofolate reductase
VRSATQQLLRVQNFMLSTDGFGTGEGQSIERPFGHADPAVLSSWAGATASWPNRTDPGGTRGLDDYFTRDFTNNIGAEIMGRGKFGPPEGGPWDEAWQGWWGEDPPFHKPVFVLTHHEREPLTLSDTTFTFVTDGIESALAQAREAADGKDVFLGGGADSINQYLAAGLVDEIGLHVAPILLGGGKRLLEGVGPDLKLEQLRAVEAPGVTHLKYRVVR